MSALATPNLFSAARSRRLACDRCHRHKLRCERSPIVVNGSIAIPLGTCKRCQKARVACQTTAGSFTGSSHGVLKGNVPMVDAEKQASEDISSNTITNTTTTSISTNTASHDDPLQWDSPMMSGDEATTMLDLDNFDFGVGDFGSVDGQAVLSPQPPKSPSPSSHPWDSGHQDDTTSSLKTPFEEFLDSAPFGSTPQINDSSTSSLSTSSSDDSKIVLQPELAGPHDDCRRRLLELHSLLFNELQCVTDAELAEALFCPESTSLSNRDKLSPGDNVVRRVLFASERLIDLLGTIGSACTNNNQPSNFRERSSSATSRVSSGSSLRFHNKNSMSLSGSLLRNSLRSGSGQPRYPATSHNMSTSSSSSFVNLPIMISFLTCYVGLLSVYRAIFTHIHEALTSFEPTRPDHHHQRGRGWSTPGAAPRGGPVVRHEYVLGIRIQMEVMTHMLERMDDAWAACLVDEREGGGDVGQLEDGRALFGRASTTALLQSMLIHEGYDFTDDGSSMGLGSLMAIQKSIRRLLRSSNFA